MSQANSFVRRPSRGVLPAVVWAVFTLSITAGLMLAIAVHPARDAAQLAPAASPRTTVSTAGDTSVPAADTVFDGRTASEEIPTPTF